MVRMSTFSIVAYDPNRREWGVAVQSKFLAVGAVVAWVQAQAGAVATQSYANLTYGPRGLELMRQGISAQEVIDNLTGEDEGRSTRQVGMVDQAGRAAAFTGSECNAWAGHLVGEGYTCQGNILLPGTVEAMAQRFEQARRGTGELADWLVEALAVGQKAGGDRRGQQSAALLVAREDGGYGGNNDRYLDLRVDDDLQPIERLKKLVGLHHLYFGQTDPANLVPIESVAEELQDLLRRTGYLSGEKRTGFDATSRKALRKLVGVENLEQRWDGEGEMIDQDVVEFLQKQYPRTG
jgi:uncharacterized Ntn-hydrolase superfamily protein